MKVDVVVVSSFMLLKDLEFSYPDELVALEPRRPSRVMWVENQQPSELTWQEFIDRIPAGDVLVVNNTKVLKRRVFVPWKNSYIEILFLEQKDALTWEVLFPAKEFKLGAFINLPGEVQAQLIQKGRPQVLKLDRELGENYFFENAEMPLPPYIQKLRPTRHAQKEDDQWYQTIWAQTPGSLASPTASLHFRPQDLHQLEAKGVQILPVTLHVGLGTFLPVTTPNLDDFQIHGEFVEVPFTTWEKLQAAKASGKKIWSLGTTATRALESVGNNQLPRVGDSFRGTTRIFIKPGYQWTVVDRLLTNFHQPESTLLALVSAFSNLATVKACYAWAIERKFRLFSYGDLSVWVRE